jgi:predicted thioredoxin/glutaredoxin
MSRLIIIESNCTRSLRFLGVGLLAEIAWNKSRTLSKNKINRETETTPAYMWTLLYMDYGV